MVKKLKMKTVYAGPEPYSEPLHTILDDQATVPEEMVVAPAGPWFNDHDTLSLSEFPAPRSLDEYEQPFGFDSPIERLQPPSPIFNRSPKNYVKSIPNTPRASMESSLMPPPAPTISPLQPPIELLQVSTASCPPALVPAGCSVPTAYLHPTALDPVTHIVVLVSGISATLSARLQLSHQSLLEPVFQAFAERVLKTRPAMVAEEVKTLLKKYATGFNYDGIKQVREEMTQTFMHKWAQMGLDCATSAKEILSKDVCESINIQLRDKHVKSILGETLLERVRLTLNQCLTRAHGRIKELAQDHMVIIDTHDRQKLAIEAHGLRDQVFRGAQVSDNVRTVASEVYAYFKISSGEFIDGCIRIILRQIMHEFSLQLSSELFDALKLSEADLPGRCRIWVE